MNEDYVLWYGRQEPPVETRTLRAGPVEVIQDGPDLRYIRNGDVEGVRRLYAAVRDHNWLTIPAVVTHWEEQINADSFTLNFTVRHHSGPIDFLWKGEVLGAADGTLVYTFDGLAQSDFRANRIGFCVLHPGHEAAGKPYIGQTPEGQIEGTLPREIGAQTYVNGCETPLFPPVASLSVEMQPDIWVDFGFEGDLFEMEDQRNWTDASFKTYCTPLSLPRPRQMRAGDRIHQRITIKWRGESRKTIASTTAEPTIDVIVGEPLATLPPIGLGLPADAAPLSARERMLLRALNPAHLRVDLTPDASLSFVERLRLGAETASGLGCALELAITLDKEPAPELRRLKEALPVCADVPIARILVYHAAEEATAGVWVRMAREILAVSLPAGTPFFGGTNAYFCQINRFRPEIAAMDGVTFSINPQVHAFDETSLAETLEAQPDTVASARAFSGDLTLIVSPVTLRPRFNPNASGPDNEADPGTLPASVDARQMSLFGAAWTLGSISALAQSGVASLTYFETVGWRGVMEAEAGSPAPFPSEPGVVFPLYHILADLCGKRDAALYGCASRQPLQVQSLALHTDTALYLWLTNLTPLAQKVRVTANGWKPNSIRRLNPDTGRQAMRHPEVFRAEFKPWHSVTEGPQAVALAPFESACLILG